MTDKQIIIDEMEKPKKYCEGIDCSWCGEKEPCIYKIANELEERLKAKEQECEAYKMEAEEGKEINAELKAENEELKEKYHELKEQNGNYIVQLNTVNEKLEQLKSEKDAFLNQFIQKISEVTDD
jgi:uncharacterized coiled-coil DUF342 family protein